MGQRPWKMAGLIDHGPQSRRARYLSSLSRAESGLVTCCIMGHARGKHGVLDYMGTSLIRKRLLLGPTVGLSLGSCADPRGVGVSYERGTPVREAYTLDQKHSALRLLQYNVAGGNYQRHRWLPVKRFLGFKVQGPGSRVQGPGSRVQGPGSRVQGPGSRVKGSGSRAQGPGSRI